MTSSAAIDRNDPLLSDPETTDHERQRTVALLLDVANDPRFAVRSQELLDLATAVRLGGAHAAGWRGVDLFAAFPPATTMRLRPRWRRWIARLFGVVAVALLALAASRLFPAAPDIPDAAASGAGPLLAWSVLLFAGQWAVAKSATRGEAEDVEWGATRLAQAMTRASIAIHARPAEDPAVGVEVLTNAADELLRAQLATARTIEALDSATRQLEESATLLVQGIDAVGTSLGRHTGALQHQISELTQVRASLERISGLSAAVEPVGEAVAEPTAEAGRTPKD